MGKSIKIKIITLIIFSLVFSTFNANASSNYKYNSTNLDNLEFRQEIDIPIDTSISQAKYQPIDIHVKFDNCCWAIDEKNHSVRIGYETGENIIEIESQIYELEYTDDEHISSCNLVFLIPEDARGDEKYFVFYDSEKSENAEYIEHLKVEDTHYFFEPISGQKIDFDYYKITEDDFVVYGVIQKGEMLGNPVAQFVVEAKPGSKEIDTTNLDQLGAFDMRYGIKGEPDYTGTTDASKVVKNILVDGNLMVRMRIETLSTDKDIKTDNIYTYYYCPSEIKKIRVNVHHEVLKDIEIEDPEVYDGTYTGIVSIKSRSATIEKMNVGDILPGIALYNEDGIIEQYTVPSNPDSVVKEVVLSTEADSDLGSKAWVCLNDPATGKTHGLIMDRNTGITDGKEDGIQVKGFVKQNVKLPGLEADTGSLFLFRNSYEKNSEHNIKLSKGFIADFNVEFIKIYSEGINRVDIESELFQKLIKIVPLQRDNQTLDETEEKKYSITTYVHFAPSFPLGSLLSAATGIKFPYIYAELYKENSYLSSGSVGRISLASIDLEFEGNIFQKIKKAIGLFDWKNISFFKKIVFPEVTAGKYIIKIFRENPVFGKERQYIGFASIKVNNNIRVDINCKPQATINIITKDQHEQNIKNVKFLLYNKDAIVAEAISKDDKTIVLKAPIYPTKPYTLKAIYQGFLIKEKQIKLGLLNILRPESLIFTIPLHNLILKIKDKWNFTPEIDVNPTLSSNEMVEKYNIIGEKIKNGEYLFSNVYATKYILSMTYKSFDSIENVKIDEDKILSLVFPAEFKIDFNFKNSYGNQLEKGKIKISRNDKNIERTIDGKGKSSANVPPGNYKITVISDEKIISSQIIDVRSNKKIDIVTSEDSIFHNMIIYLGFLLAIFSILFLLWKKKIYACVKLLVIALLIISVVSPWWTLNGDDGDAKTNTNAFFIPSNIVTYSSSDDISGGDISQVPEEVTMIFNLFSILLIVTCLILGLSIITKNKLKKTTIFLSVLSVLFLIVLVSIFYYTMMQLTEVGVGSFMGSGNLEISMPGVSESKIINCNWGPGIGFYLTLVGIALLFVLSLRKKINPLLQ